ncbi:TRAP transporter small permease [Rhodovibrionaceae bacterium A322]
MAGTAQVIRKQLDRLYLFCGILAAINLLLMLGIICAQMIFRWSGLVFPGSTNYAGYCMAAASFFALAYALNHGAHIRVSLLLTHLGDKRRWAELWCFGIASVLAILFAYFAIKATYGSYKWNDISQGQDAWPLWIPQLPMAAGTVVLAIALLDHFVRLLSGRLPELGDAAAEDHHVE